MAKKKGSKVIELPGIEGPGVAPISIPRIDKLAAAYVRERDKRCEMTPKEIAAKQKLISALHDNVDKIGRDKDGVLTYRFDDMVIVLKPGKESLKVKAIDTEGEPE